MMRGLVLYGLGRDSICWMNAHFPYVFLLHLLAECLINRVRRVSEVLETEI